jgi:hypothetical protein
MGSTNEHTANESGVSTAERFFEKLGIVFSNVQSTILKDLSDELLENGQTWDDVENAFKEKNLEGIEKIVNAIIKKIGYDLSSAGESNKAYQLFVTIIGKSVGLSEKVIDIVKLVREKDSSEDKQSLESAVQELVKGANSGNGEFGGLKEIIDAVKDLIDLFKKLSDIEWNQIANEIEGFGEFIKNNYFTEKFAKRIIDYVLITFLKNARDVFADDFENLLVNANDETSNRIKGTLTKLGIDVSKFDELKDCLINYKSLLSGVEDALKQKNIEKAAQAMGNIAQGLVSTQSLNLGGAVGDAVNNFVNLTENQLESCKKILRQRIEGILEEIAPAYNTTAKVLDRIYAVLEFLGVIGKKKVDLIECVTSNIPKNGVTDSLKLPSLEIPVFDWDVFEQIFTKPKAYLKSEFKLENHEDAEKIIIKVMNLVRAFNKDFPQIESAKQFIWELIVIVKNKISELEKDANDAYSELVNQLKAIKEYFLDLLKVCESILIEVKKTLNDEAKGLIADLVNQFGKDIFSSDINEQISNIKEKLKKLDILDDENNVINKKFELVVVDTLEDAICENVSEFCEKSKVKSVFEAVPKEVVDCKADIIESFNENLVTKLKNKVFDVWNKGFGGLVKGLKEEFNSQTENIPDNYDKLKNFVTGSLDDLLQGKSIDNPFSDIDLHAFYKIFVKNISCFSELKDIDQFFDAFTSSVKDSVEKHIKAICEKIDSIDLSKLNTLVQDIFYCWLEKIQPKFFDLVVKPYINEIRDIVYDWAKNVLSDAVEGVQKQIKGVADLSNGLISAQSLTPNASGQSSDSNSVFNWNNCQNSLSEYFKDVDISALTDIVTGIIDLKDNHDADSWSTWKNAIKLAVNVYKALPENIKKALSDFIDLPDLSEVSKYLPDYDYDAKNKFLAVTLLDKKTEDKSDNAVGEASICLQLLIFIGEEPSDKEKSKDSTDEGSNAANQESSSGDKNDDSKGKDGEGESEKKPEVLYILPTFKGSFDTLFNIGKSHCVMVGAHAEMNCKADSESKSEDSIMNQLTSSKLGCYFKFDSKISNTEFHWLDDANALSGYLELLFKRGQVGSDKKIDEKTVEPLTFFDTDVVSLKVDNYPQKAFIGYKNGFDVGYIGGLRGLNLALKLKEQNNFFKTILKDDIVVSLKELELQYSYKDGFKLNNLNTHINIPFNADIDLDVVKFKNLSLDLGLDGNKLETSVLTSFTADLSGVAITFTNMGLGIECELPFNGHKGFDFSPKFTYPNGLGISIDVEGVKGGGVVQWDKEKGRFFGGLELTVMEKFGAEAVLVFTTGKGTDPFSCMGALCVYFDPGIQLGMGFSLEGVGGSFGVNRMLSTDNLRSAVYDGTLESALFFKDVTKNVDTVLANIDKYYPIKKGQVYFGLLGKIAWGTILKADFGLFIQAPSPVAIVIAGVVKVSVSEKTESLLVINACFLGGIDFDKGIFFDADLFDSKIVGIELHGSISLRIFWGGDTKGFILSIGGFHPEYKPEKGFNLPDLKRVGMKLDYKIIKFSLDAYFAITSNTVQFGTSLDMKIGWDKFGLTGYAAFNALFQFNPFKFMVDMKAGLAVKIGSKKICSIDLSFALSGPAQWRAKGSASFWILFIKIKVGFDYSWGKKSVAGNRNRIDVLPLFIKQISEKNNWKLISSDLTDNMVSLVKVSDFVLQPADTISFNQSAIPLNVEMGCYGEDDVNDFKMISIDDVYIGNKSQNVNNGGDKGFKDEQSSFAPTLIKRLSEKEKLKAKSYELMNGGFKLTAVSGVENGFDKDAEVSYSGETEQAYESMRSLWETAYNYSLDIEKFESESDDDKISEIMPVVGATLQPAYVRLKPWGGERVSVYGRRKWGRKRIVCIEDSATEVRNQCYFCRNKSLSCCSSSEETITEVLSPQYTKTTRCSYRRNSNGFNRYVRQCDDLLYSDTKKILSTED